MSQEEENPIAEKEPAGDQGPSAEDRAEGGGDQSNKRFIRKFFLFLTGFLVLAGLSAVILFQTGTLESFVRDRFSAKMDRSGISFKAKTFSLKAFPLRLELNAAEFDNKTTKQRILTVESAKIGLSLSEFFSVGPTRDISVESVSIDGMELTLDFDEKGRSNLFGVRFVEDSDLVKVKYEAADVSVKNGRVRIGDKVRDLDFDARGVVVDVNPKRTPRGVIENQISLRTGNSSFRYENSKLDDISVVVAGVLLTDRFEVGEFKIDSPTGSLDAKGSITDFKNPRYNFDVESSLDVRALTTLLSPGDILNGNGTIRGKFSGVGTDFKFEGRAVTDALTKDGFSLRALDLNASYEGRETQYLINGSAVAEALTFGNVEIDLAKLSGMIRGTGTDFEWVGQLQALAVRTGAGTIGGLILQDATLGRDAKGFKGRSDRLSFRDFVNQGLTINQIDASDFRISNVQGSTEISVSGASAESLKDGDLRLSGIRSDSIAIQDNGNGLRIVSPKLSARKGSVGDLNFESLESGKVSVSNRNGRTEVSTSSLEARRGSFGAFSLEGVKAKDIEAVDSDDGLIVYSKGLQTVRIQSDAVSLGVVDVAGVRLRIFKGTAEFRTDNPITAESASIRTPDGSANGALSSLKAERLVYVVDPTGTYRATADLSIGGGSIGRLNLGSATAAIELSPESLSVRSLKANILGGVVSGVADFALRESENSRLSFSFTDVQASEVFSMFGSVATPVTASISGGGDFTFSNNDFTNASGSFTARSRVDADVASDRIPISGEVNLSADNGSVSFENARLVSRNSLAEIRGSFKLSDLYSDLDLSLGRLPGSAEGNTAEIDAIVRPLISGTEIGKWAEENRFQPFGDVDFRGKLVGRFENPDLRGSISVTLVALRQKILGGFSTEFGINPDSLEIKNANLREDDGGTIFFSALIPRFGENNIDVSARLDEIDFGSVLVLIPYEFPATVNSIDANTSGRLDVTGLPGAMSGSAELSASGVTFGSTRFDRVETRARLGESKINFDRLTIGFGSDSLEAPGSYDIVSSAFDFNVTGAGIPLATMSAFIPSDSRIREIGGTASLRGFFRGRADDSSTFVTSFTGSLLNATLNGSLIGDAVITGKTTEEKFEFAMNPSIGGSFPAIVGSVDLKNPSLPFNARIRADKSSLEPVFSLIPLPTEEKVKGSVSGAIDLAGELVGNGSALPIESLRATASIDQMEVRLPQTSFSSTRPFTFSLRDGVLTAGDKAGIAFAGGGSDFVISGTKAFDDDSQNNLNLRGRLNLGILNAFFSNTIMSGVANIDIRITGPNSDEVLNGTAVLDRASLSTFVSSDRVTLDQLIGRINFTSNRVDINSIRGNLGGGKVSISGIATLFDDFRIERLILNMSGEGVRVPFPRNFQTVGNASLRIDTERNGSSLRTLISGRIIPRRALYETDIDLADVTGGRRESPIGQSSTASSLGDVILDLSIEGRNALEVRNNLADLTASLSLRVTGDVTSPQISGRVTSNSGLIFFRRDRYEIQRAELLFPPRANTDPSLNLQAVAEIRGYQVIVGLNGVISDAESLNLSVRSNPSLPQADVISLITTGNLSNTESGIPTVAQSGISTAAEVLTNEIINKPVTRATDRLFGLNRFELDPIISGSRLNPTARLTVGRQINRNLAVTYSTNLSDTQNQVVAFEYRVSNRISFVAQYEQRELSNVTRQSNNFSFEVRFRRRF